MAALALVVLKGLPLLGPDRGDVDEEVGLAGHHAVDDIGLPRLEARGQVLGVEQGARRADEGSLWPPDFFVERYAESYREEMSAFIDCILDCRDSPVSGAEGRSAVVLALAAWRSYREGRPVGAQEVAGGAAST